MTVTEIATIWGGEEGLLKIRKEVCLTQRETIKPTYETEQLTIRSPKEIDHGKRILIIVRRLYQRRSAFCKQR